MKTQIKICGITDAEMAFFAAKKGANWIGIVCAKRSARYVVPSSIPEIAQAAKEGGATPILVFENERCDIISDLVKQNAIDYVQLHGEKSQYLNGGLSIAIKKIFAISLSQQGRPMEIYNKKNMQADFLLFDSMIAGSGNRFSWTAFKKKKLFQKKPFFLAGGLNSSNVLHAIDCLNPFAVDVSTGVEIMPGVKDKTLIEKFIITVRGNSL